ncbi:YcxB family protein [Tahibacter amnicola]|uniref:YcxB family protein n=1 Tax=Tahibacter amnicola TaxID=2976241 RepID=A0ABY6BDZ5_9GAMM|nr:YcxB family protein [Tahibacter amnicola]UXI66550.1 YcxB family protein [Tahibacter amnicola]
MKVEYITDPSDAQLARSLTVRSVANATGIATSSAIAQFLTVMLFFMALFANLTVIAIGKDRTRSHAIAAASLALAGTVHLAWRYRWRRRCESLMTGISQRPSTPVTITLGDDGISVTSPLRHAHWPWTGVRGVRTLERHTALTFFDYETCAIPDRAFATPEEKAEFSAQVRRHLPLAANA